MKRRHQQQMKMKRKLRRMGVSALSRMFSNGKRNILRRRKGWLGMDYNEIQQINKSEETQQIISPLAGPQWHFFEWKVIISYPFLSFLCFMFFCAFKCSCKSYRIVRLVLEVVMLSVCLGGRRSLLRGQGRRCRGSCSTPPQARTRRQSRRWCRGKGGDGHHCWPESQLRKAPRTALWPP